MMTTRYFGLKKAVKNKKNELRIAQRIGYSQESMKTPTIMPPFVASVHRVVLDEESSHSQIWGSIQ